MHTDTKSHNVSIRVLSGMDKMKLNLNMHHVQELRHLTNSLSIAQYHLKKAMDQRKASRDKDAKKYFNNLAIRFRDEIQGIKKQISIVKKFIK
jgi:alpha-L-arabinofuranosidase